MQLALALQRCAFIFLWLEINTSESILEPQRTDTSCNVHAKTMTMKWIALVNPLYISFTVNLITGHQHTHTSKVFTVACEFAVPLGNLSSHKYYVSFNKEPIPTGHSHAKEIHVTVDKNGCQQESNCSGECVRLHGLVRPSPTRRKFRVACKLCEPPSLNSCKVESTIIYIPHRTTPTPTLCASATEFSTAVATTSEASLDTAQGCK